MPNGYAECRFGTEVQLVLCPSKQMLAVIILSHRLVHLGIKKMCHILMYPNLFPSTLLLRNRYTCTYTHLYTHISFYAHISIYTRVRVCQCVAYVFSLLAGRD